MVFKAKFLSFALIICTLQILLFNNYAKSKTHHKHTAAKLSTQSQSPSPQIINEQAQDQIAGQMPSASQMPDMQPLAAAVPVAQSSETQTQQATQASVAQAPTTQEPATQKIKTQEQASKKTDIKKSSEGTLTSTELDFEVENQTGKTVYITCFSYIKKRPFSRWHWNKSPIYKIEDNKNLIVDLPTIPDAEDRNNTFGYVGVFDSKKEAEDSTFELLNDNQKIDLDIITQLHNKKVTLQIEKYGLAGEFYDFDFTKIDEKVDKKASKKKDVKKTPELDFYVENKTGKTIYITCFVYEKKAKGTWLAKKTTESWTVNEETRDDMSVWRFDKTPVIKIKPNETGLIDVDTIIEPRDRIYVRGYLAIFDEDEKEMADKSIYELTPQQRKLDIGKLIDLKNKNVTIYTERYGITGNLVDYVVKPTQKPDIKKIINGYFK